MKKIVYLAVLALGFAMGWILKCSGPAKYVVVHDTIKALRTDTLVAPKIVEQTRYKVRVDTVTVKTTDTLFRVDTVMPPLNNDFILANLDSILKMMSNPPILDKVKELVKYQRYSVGLTSFDEMDYYTRKEFKDTIDVVMAKVYLKHYLYKNNLEKTDVDGYVMFPRYLSRISAGGYVSSSMDFGAAMVYRRKRANYIGMLGTDGVRAGVAFSLY